MKVLYINHVGILAGSSKSLYELLTALTNKEVYRYVVTPKGSFSDELKKGLNNIVKFSFDNFEPEMVVFLFRTIMKDYQIKFNVRTDLTEELRETFSKRYIKYIV